jgi:N-glycosidase YbiA
MINKFDGEHAFLSNFFECDVTFERITYPTAENAFQAAKVLDKEKRKEFINITAGQAKRLGRKVDLREDWNSVRLNVMFRILCAKFFTNKELMQKLQDTGDEELVEGNTWNDTFWGVCNGKGENNLGKLLMHVRQLLNDYDLE